MERLQKERDKMFKRFDDLKQLQEAERQRTHQLEDRYRQLRFESPLKTMAQSISSMPEPASVYPENSGTGDDVSAEDECAL